MKKTVKKNAIKRQEFGKILGIHVISTSASSVLAGINNKLSHNNHFYIVTPNPELILMAEKNEMLKNALNEADFPVPDGTGLNFASLFLHGKKLNIIPGRKLFDEIVKAAAKKRWKVFLLGGVSGEAYLAARELSAKYKDLDIESDQGPVLDKNADPVAEVDKKLHKDVIDKINKFIPDLLFVAFGNPKQEIWISKNIGRLRIGGAMGVGGTFRYIAGMSKLPPAWMEKIGLEWLWRLVTEPKRFGRIINAVIVFPWKVVQYRLSK